MAARSITPAEKAEIDREIAAMAAAARWPNEVPFPPEVRIRFDPPLRVAGLTEVTLHHERDAESATFIVYVENGDSFEMWDLIAKPGHDPDDPKVLVIAATDWT